MSTLYAFAQTFNGRVVGTCNASEIYVGYFTKFGDGVSDVEPIAKLTVTEVKKLGHELGIPSKWVEKTPSDVLPESCDDEEKFGFTYAVLDDFICCDKDNIPLDIQEKIKYMHNRNLFKTSMLQIPTFVPLDIFSWEYENIDEDYFPDL